MAAGPIPPPLSSSLTTAPPAQPTSPYMQSGMVGGAQEGIIDATQLKLFIEQSFQGAVLLEEHQVHVVLGNELRPELYVIVDTNKIYC